MTHINGLCQKASAHSPRRKPHVGQPGRSQAGSVHVTRETSIPQDHSVAEMPRPIDCRLPGLHQRDVFSLCSWRARRHSATPGRLMNIFFLCRFMEEAAHDTGDDAGTEAPSVLAAASAESTELGRICQVKSPFVDSGLLTSTRFR